MRGQEHILGADDAEMARGTKSWRAGVVVGLSILLGGWACTSSYRPVQAQSAKALIAGGRSIFGLTVEPGVSSSSALFETDGQWLLVWSDEFNQQDGSAPDPAKWTFDEGVGNNGWGNNELEYYTTRSKNVVIIDGNLVITALRESFTESSGMKRNFTSARLKTRELFSQQHGRFEARIKIPAGPGLWPAFWLLGSNIRSVGWPSCGEIDIMENKEAPTIHGTIHGPGYSGDNGISSTYTLVAGHRFSDDFHIFAVEWEPNAIRFFVDNDLYAIRTPADLPKGAQWVFDHPFFILLNLAVGGNWPGPPDSTTPFPAHMLVDYVRVYKRSNNEPAAFAPVVCKNAKRLAVC
jgi:beta-glucanase (GH16 family)